MGAGLVSLYSRTPVLFECHDDPGEDEEEDEEQGVVAQVGPLALASQGVVLQDSLALCVCGWGGVKGFVRGDGADVGWCEGGGRGRPRLVRQLHT